jgi:hypothetical protein
MGNKSTSIVLPNASFRNWDSSTHFIPKNLIETTKERLDMLTQDLKDYVEEFIENYEEYIDEVKTELEPYGLFNEDDYPSPGELKDKFGLQYRFFDLTIPSQISQELKDEEYKNFQKLMNETKEMGVLALREGFQELVSHLTEKLNGKIDGKNKRLHQESIDKVYTFFDMFQKKNVFGDIELEKISLKAKEILEGINKNDLKDKDLTTELKKELEVIKTETDNCIKTYKRKLSFMGK